jgi:hypothetical protein
VALVAAGTLAYEILLVRVFAIEQFHHFAYMAIGVAMLGFGASGTVLALVGTLDSTRRAAWFAWSSVLASAALLAAPTLTDRVGIDATQLAWSGGQWLRLGLVYLLLAVPFAAGAATVLLGIQQVPKRPGRVYGASFAGSAAGVIVAVGALSLLAPANALAVPAAVAGLGALAAAVAHADRRTPVVATAVLLLALAAAVRPPWRLDMTPYKGMPQVEALPGARRVAERSGLLGWVAAVEAPAFRHAPGLSLGYRGAFPPQLALLVDGDLSGAASRIGTDSAALELFDWLPSAVPYALGSVGHVLVLGAGAGTEVWNAAAHHAERVTAVELHSDVVDLARGYAEPARGTATSVGWVIGDARAFAARTAERYGLISIGPAGGPGAAVAGVHALNEDFLHTVDAYVRYLELLEEDGVLAVTRWLTVPPRETVRLVLTAGQALERSAPEQLSDGIVVARSWGTATVLVKPSGFGPDELESLRRWADARRFDIDFTPGMTVPESRYHTIGEPVLFLAASAAAEGTEAAARFAAAYPFDVRPATDARPYPHHFLRTAAVGTFFRSGRGDWLPFAEWGTVALVATLVQSLVLAAVCLVLPTLVRTRAALGGRLLPLLGYFGAIGFAYLAAEIAAIQQLVLLLGHPVYAVVAVLFALLALSGVGSAWSDGIAARPGWRAAAALAVLLALLAAAALTLVHAAQPAPLAVRAAVALAVLAPLAVLMGMPFALGLRRVAGGDTVRVAWAWSANGFASVVAAPLAALIALEAGSRVLLLCAAAAYAAAAALHAAAPFRSADAG